MGYVDRNLMPGEMVIAKARLHWLVFLPALLWIGVSVGVIIAGSFFDSAAIAWSVAVVGVALLFFAMVKGIGAGLRYWTSEFAVTTKRLVVKVGLIRRNTLELLLSKVEAVGVNQTIIGRLLNYGTLVITGTGGSMNAYDGIGSPLAFRKKVQQEIENVQSRRG